MKTLKEIKEEYAKELGYSRWDMIGYNCNTESRNDEIARRYAIECVKASLEKAAENAESYFDTDDESHVDKSTITSPDNIVLL